MVGIVLRGLVLVIRGVAVGCLFDSEGGLLVVNCYCRKFVV